MKTVAIIGAGTAGLATSIFLSRLGYRCDIYEAVAQPQAIGAGLLLQPQGLNVLNDLGILTEILQCGSQINTLYGQNNKGKEIMDFHYKDLFNGLFGIGIHRGQLFNSLLQQAQKSFHQAYFGHQVTEVTQDGAEVLVKTDKNTIQHYDMAIIANGTWSNLTQKLNIKVKHKPYPWGALWKIFDNPDAISSGTLSQKYKRAHTMAGLLPSGTHPVTGRACISFFWSLKADKFDQWQDNSIEKWKTQVLRLWPEIHPLINTINSHDDLKFVQYADTIMNQWHDNKIVIIGDAAHAMSPQLGQGANMALVDAQQLYVSLKHNKTIESALIDYSQQRKKHLKFYQYSSRLLTPFFQSNSAVAAAFRDLVFPPMKYFPLAKKHALTTLFGVKTSIFHNKPNIDLRALADRLKN
jgi:2-polyprenyl-6-methoxyphenol hydroxylase-like FAD-dependent oxidoreductase